MHMYSGLQVCTLPIMGLGRYNDFDDKPGLCNGFHEHKTYAKRMPATWSLQQYIMLRGVGSNVRPLHSPSSKYTVRNEWESTHDPIILTYISVFLRPYSSYSTDGTNMRPTPNGRQAIGRYNSVSCWGG